MPTNAITDNSINQTNVGENTAIHAPSDKQYQKKKALEDIKAGIVQWRIWTLLAYQDIKLRYRRSALGPFWVTISMAIIAYSMGFLYGHLFHMDLQVYFPFVTAGMLTWTLISALIMEITEAFTTYDKLIKQIKLPYSLYVHRVVWRNILIFFHNILVIIPIIILFHKSAKIDWATLMLVPGLIIIYLAGFIFGMISAIVGARYRDISQIIKSLIQVVFFLTPVMWSPAILPVRYQFIAYDNPFYAFIELIRNPLIGSMPSARSVVMSIFILLFGAMLMWALFVKYRSRIVYWV